MSWAKFDDSYLENRKVSPVSAYATLLHMVAIIRCARLESDGRLTKTDMDVVLALTKIPESERAGALGELVDAGLVHRDGNAFEVHDFLDYNPSHAELEAKRASGATRVRNWRRNSRRNAVTNATTNAVSNGVCAERPDPLPSSMSNTHTKEGDTRTNAVSNAVTAYQWLEFFKVRHREKTGRFYGNGQADATALGNFATLLDSMPTEQRDADWGNRERIVAEFLARDDQRTVKAGWPFAFFATDFRALAIEPSKRQVGVQGHSNALDPRVGAARADQFKHDKTGDIDV